MNFAKRYGENQIGSTCSNRLLVSISKIKTELKVKNINNQALYAKSLKYTNEHPNAKQP